MTDRLIRCLCVPPVVAALLLAAPQGRAELRAEFFWNDDPGVGRATALTLPDGDADGFRAASVPVTGMRDGLNILGIRARNAGQWSVTHSAMVWSRPSSPADVEAAEFFWNDDPGVGAATPMTLAGGEGLRAASLDASGLAEGLNTLGVRVMSRGQWSTTHSTAVWNRGSHDPSAITAAEYFWDDDPGVGNATAIPALTGPDDPSAPGVPRQATLDASGLAEGEHLLGLRVRGALGWSVTHSARVTVRGDVPLLITGIEYFWGDDPGTGNGTQVPVTPAAEVSFDPLTVPFPAEESDEYTLSIRPLTERGWGPAYTWTRANVPLTALSLTPSQLAMKAGETLRLTADPVPADALHPAVTWDSSDPAVAAVAPDGTVTALAKGTATLTATSTRYPDITASCDIAVTGDLSGIGATAADGVTVSALPGRIVVEDAVSGPVTVYLPTGATVAVRPPAPHVTIPLPPGTYLVSVNATLHKVALR